MNLLNNCSEFEIFMTRASLPVVVRVNSCSDLLTLTLSRPCGTITRHDTIHEKKQRQANWPGLQSLGLKKKYNNTETHLRVIDDLL